MKAQVECSIINEAVRIASLLAPPMTGTITLQSTDKRLYLHSSSELARCRVQLPGTVQGDATFALPISALSDSVRGRKEVSLELVKGVLTLVDGRYKASLSTVDALEIEDFKPEDEAKKWKLSSDLSTWLFKTVTSIGLKASGGSFMPLAIQAGAKSTFVACYDQAHMAFARSTDVQGDLQTVLPFDTMRAVLDVFKGVDCVLHLTKSSLWVSNKMVQVALSLPSADGDEVISIESVLEKAKEAVKADGSKITMVKSDVMTFLDNARAVATKERPELGIASKNGKLQMSVVTNNGQVKALCKAKTAADFSLKIDYEFFAEAVKGSGDELQLKVVDDAFLMVKRADSYSVIALNQES